MPPEDIAKVIPLCVRCGRAKNPAASLQWFDAEDGLRCAHCYKPPTLPDTKTEPMAVITCPACRGRGQCNKCADLGVVRVPMNGIPVWSWGEPAEAKESTT